MTLLEKLAALQNRLDKLEAHIAVKGGAAQHAKAHCNRLLLDAVAGHSQRDRDVVPVEDSECADGLGAISGHRQWDRDAVPVNDSNCANGLDAIARKLQWDRDVVPVEDSNYADGLDAVAGHRQRDGDVAPVKSSSRANGLDAIDGRRQWDGDGVPLKDSNCAGIGSEEDKALRKEAARAEPAWRAAGRAEGLEVWRIENFEVVPWPKNKYGSFHKGDSYIVLHTLKDVGGRRLLHQIHFWLGEQTSTDEMGTAAYKAVELDDYFDGEPTQHREIMGYESEQFHKLFPRLTYLEGGVDSGFRKTAPDVLRKRLLHVRRTGHGGMRSTEVHLSRESLNQGDCFVLDAGFKIYVWDGPEASPFERQRANQLAKTIAAERGGHAQTVHDLDAEFWELLGGEGPIKASREATDAEVERNVREPVLYCASDAGGALTVTEVARGELSDSMLRSDDVMLLDASGELFVWVGGGASTGEGRSAMHLAMQYLGDNRRPRSTPVHLFREGQTIRNKRWLATLGC